MTIRTLLERRATIKTELETIHTANPDALTGEAETRWNTLTGELSGLEAKISRQAVVDDLERRIAGQPLTGSGDRHLDQEIRTGFSLVRAIASQVPGLNVDAAREREISQEIARRSGRTFQGIAIPTAVFETRVQTAGTDPSGGYLVGTDHRADQYIDLLRTLPAVRRMGARVLSGLSGNLEIPKQTGATTGGWVGENQALTLSDMAFGSLAMTPRHAGCVTEFSRQLLQQASPDVETLIRRDFALELARVLDVAAISGSGVSSQPLGILNTPGIGSVAMGANGGSLSYDACADLMGQLADMNADEGTTSFLTNTKVRRQAAKIKDGVGEPLGVGVVFQGQPVTYTNNIPSNLVKGSSGAVCSALIYANWADLLIGIWAELDLLVNPYETTAYQKGAVQVRGMMTVDIGVRHAESFAAIRDIVA